MPKLDAQDTVGDRDQRHTSRVNKAFEAVVNTRQRRDRGGARQRMQFLNCEAQWLRGRQNSAALVRQQRTRHPGTDARAVSRRGHWRRRGRALRLASSKRIGQTALDAVGPSIYGRRRRGGGSSGIWLALGRANCQLTQRTRPSAEKSWRAVCHAAGSG